MRVKLIVLLAVLFSCKKENTVPPINDQVDLDGKIINDSSFVNPSAFLVSAAAQSPSPGDPVIIAVHGFSASNFEWKEFSMFCSEKGNLPVSRVLLGGHGRDYEDFRKASWTDWQLPVIDEYRKLVAAGFTKISFVAASTGCPLVLDMIAAGKIDLSFVNQVIFIDPIVVPSNKQLSLAPALGGTVIHYTESGLDEGENGYWYRFRPAEALIELNKLTQDIRKRLENTMELPPDIHFTVYKSERDGSADPVSAVILDKGLKNCDVLMINSDLHVFTRLAGRKQVTDGDRQLQQNTFAEIHSIATGR